MCEPFADETHGACLGVCDPTRADSCGAGPCEPHRQVSGPTRFECGSIAGTQPLGASCSSSSCASGLFCTTDATGASVCYGYCDPASSTPCAGGGPCLMFDPADPVGYCDGS